MRFATLPDRTAESPWRGRRRSSADRSSRARHPARDRPDTRTTPYAGRRACAAYPGRERHRVTTSVPKRKAPALRPARSASMPPRRRNPRARAREAGSIPRIPAAGWKTTLLPRASPEAGDPRQEDARARPTCRYRSPVAPVLVKFSRISPNGATGAGFEGGPEATCLGGISTPDPTASARKASERIGLRVSLSRPSFANT